MLLYQLFKDFVVRKVHPTPTLTLALTLTPALTPALTPTPNATPTLTPNPHTNPNGGTCLPKPLRTLYLRAGGAGLELGGLELAVF